MSPLEMAKSIVEIAEEYPSGDPFRNRPAAAIARALIDAEEKIKWLEAALDLYRNAAKIDQETHET